MTSDASIEALHSIDLAGLGPVREEVVAPKVEAEVFRARYDYTTLVYDAVWDGASRLRAYCPKLLNLVALISEGRLTVSGEDSSSPRIEAHLRYDVLEWEVNARPDGLILRIGDEERSCGVSLQDVEAFKGRNVLLTMSKDNRPEWISAWARHHVEHHGADGVVLVDNGSRSTTPQELLQSLAEVRGLATIRVVHAPLPFGPAPNRLQGNARARFLQVGMLNLMKHRYLAHARAVLITDVDELVTGPDGKSVFDAAAKSWLGLVRFHGHWWDIGSPTGEVPTHADHTAIVEGAKPCPTKYCVVPRSPVGRHSWTVHRVDAPFSRLLPKNRMFDFRHCRQINSNWKSRTEMFR